MMKSLKTILGAVTCASLFIMPCQMSAQTVDGRDFSIDGFAACTSKSGTKYYRAEGTTGGQGGKVVYADNLTQLQVYLQAADPYIVLVDHDIASGITCYVDALETGRLCDKQDGSQGVATTYGERILIAPNKTLIGVTNPTTGQAPLLSRITFVMQSVDNIIIRNCRFTVNDVPVLKNGENKIVAWRNGAQIEVGDPDCISIQADKESAKTNWGGHIWVDHCEFFNGNAANKDRYDGLLDCKNNVQWMTFSYNYFHNHDKACLFGKGNSDIFDDCRTISFHHNYFKDIEGSRLPLQRGGYLHYANNFQENCEDGWDVRTQAIGYIEACYFLNTKSPVRSDREGSLNINKTADYDVIYSGCNNLMEGYTNIDGAKVSKNLPVSSTDWIPTKTDAAYALNKLDKTADVPEVLRTYAGAGKIEIYTAYADAVPAVDFDELAHAAANKLTADSYDENGNTVKPGNFSSINEIGASATPAKVEYFSISGMQLTAPSQGVNIVRTTYTDGSVTTGKIMVK